ncbi:type I phosphodiesterase/nucleotide pyrophosphatase [Propionicimonas paludicola]|uniref:Type I phosphodiesterase/nucleotide pyrophosphatase n=1 Tax=Propionicimonas paludicola TaxID=185243 RepID=A0A2A9CQH8_9ACTN|nr:nucleotide pyrophosphatase/phosphodiesterase family protein [Propionicimonas paludicola]PFG16598.1 type I phosphodiesterase/nucleotide pyrophosphatase [Propionicimonas paludicola]
MKPRLPDYGGASLADLLPGVGAQLGVPNAVDTIGLPAAEKYLVFLVDGLGAALLDEYAEHAPYLASLRGRQLTCGVPSTTATSITSLGTGLPPGRHGLAGYSFWYPPSGQVLATLRWPAEISALDVQPQLTYFERLQDAGVATAVIAPAHFAGSGLSTAALRGPAFLPVRDESDQPRRVELAVEAMSRGQRAVGYLYERNLDHAGHERGVGSTAWLRRLAEVDALAQALRSGLSDEVVVLITGDHGMVNVPKTNRLIVEDEPELLTGVRALAGEGRLRQLMTAEPDAVAARWRDRLGEQAWVRTRAEAEAEGWFGPLSPSLAPRFGDVLVARSDDGAVMTRTLPREMSLVGMHGSLTAAEMDIPLLIG